MAFEAQLDDPGNFDIYVIDLATGATRRITSDPALDWAPSWSPDGRWIGFTSRRSGADELYVIDASSGAGERAITSGPGAAVRLQWSPDGRRVAFGSSRTGNADIFVADPDGTNAMAITTSPADDWDPAWSPDGGRIAFLSYRDNGVASLYVMDADGRNLIRLSTDAYRESGGFTWSPDGRSIVHAAAPRLPAF
jgi:Tol biopolymer transport system component